MSDILSEEEFLDLFRQEGPSPLDYKDDNGDIDWDDYQDDYDDWTRETGFPNIWWIQYIEKVYYIYSFSIYLISYLLILIIF